MAQKPTSVDYYYKEKGGNRNPLGDDKYIRFFLDFSQGTLFITSISDTLQPHLRIDAPIPLAALKE